LLAVFQLRLSLINDCGRQGWGQELNRQIAIEELGQQLLRSGLPILHAI
jgi:hypothetical protein